jgi:DNA-binding response OmpR family regulator
VSQVGVKEPILVVESDRARGEELTTQLAADGYRVELARTAEHARVLARENPPRLVLLGALEAPHVALALLEEIRGGGDAERVGVWDGGLLVLVIAACADALDVLRAFEAGADDYVTAGGYLELRARMRAVLRRTEARGQDEQLLTIGSLRIDLRSRAATLDDVPIELRRLEFDLLAQLASEPRRVFAREELLRSVWGYRAGCSTRTVDSHASRLRHKLADGEAGAVWIVGVRGVGYRLV